MPKLHLWLPSSPTQFSSIPWKTAPALPLPLLPSPTPFSTLWVSGCQDSPLLTAQALPSAGSSACPQLLTLFCQIPGAAPPLPKKAQEEEALRNEAGLGFEPWCHWLCLSCSLGCWCTLAMGMTLGPCPPPLPSMPCTQGKTQSMSLPGLGLVRLGLQHHA